MTPEAIAKARDIIAFANRDVIGERRFIANARTGWGEALDEVERLQKILNSQDEVLNQRAVDEIEKLKNEAKVRHIKQGDITEYVKKGLFLAEIVAEQGTELIKLRAVYNFIFDRGYYFSILVYSGRNVFSRSI